MATALNIDTIRRRAMLYVAADAAIAAWCTATYPGHDLLVTEGADAASEAEFDQCPGIAVNNGDGGEDYVHSGQGRDWQVDIECRLRDTESAALPVSELPAPAAGVRTAIYTWPARLATLAGLVETAIFEAFKDTNVELTSMKPRYDHRSAWPIVRVTVSCSFKSPPTIGGVPNLVD